MSKEQILSQQVADTREYTKLISASLVDMNEMLESLNETTNNLGAASVKSGAQVNQLETDSKETSEKLKTILEAQTKLDTNITEFKDKLTTFEENKADFSESLTQINNNTQLIENTFNNAGAQFQEQIDRVHVEYAEGIKKLDDTMTSIEESVENINYRAQFDDIKDTLVEQSEKLVESDKQMNARQEELMGKLEDFTTKLTEAYELLSTIHTQGQDVQADLRTALARANSIELSLEAINSTNVDTTDFVGKFDEAFAELKLNVEEQDDSQQETVETE